MFSAATLLSHNTAVLFSLATNIFVLGLMLFQRMKKSGSPLAFRAPSFGNWVKAQIGIFFLWSPWIFTFIRQVSRVYQRFWIPETDLGHRYPDASILIECICTKSSQSGH